VDAVTAALAFAAALGTMSNLKPDAKSNRGGYVSLSALLEASRPILAAHGLGVWQDTRTIDGEIQVRTIIVGDGAHISSEWLGMVPAERGGQAVGAALTFLRRFSLQAMLGITGGDDDAVVPRGQVAELGAAFTRAGIRDRQERLDRVALIIGRTVESSKELSESEVAKVIAELNEMRP